jgi:hypothetical protein
MATTYELLTDAGHILGDIEDENGEITEATMAGMDEWIEAAEDKLGRIRAVILRCKNEQALLREEEKRLEARRHRLNIPIGRVTDYAASLLQAQEAMGGEAKVKTETYSCRIASNVKVHVDDKSLVDAAWLKTKEPDVDLAGARAAMKGGADLAGLSLQTTYHVRWG